MSRKNQFLVTLFFEALGLGLLFYAASRTLDFVQQTMPGEKQFMGYLYLLSTGIGALIWRSVYLKKAKGAAQRGIAFGMGIFDLLGEFVLVYADTQYVSSQAGKVVMTAEELGLFILASVGIIMINAIAYYAFTMADPDAIKEQKAQDLVDEISDAAHKQLNTPEEKKKMIDEYSPQIRHAVMSEVADAISNAVGRRARAVTTPQDATPPQKALPVSELHVPEKEKVNWLEFIGSKLKGNTENSPTTEYQSVVAIDPLRQPTVKIKNAERYPITSKVSFVVAGTPVEIGEVLNVIPNSEGPFATYALYKNDARKSFGFTDKDGLDWIVNGEKEVASSEVGETPAPFQAE